MFMFLLHLSYRKQCRQKKWVNHGGKPTLCLQVRVVAILLPMTIARLQAITLGRHLVKTSLVTVTMHADSLELLGRHPEARPNLHGPVGPTAAGLGRSRRGA